MNRIPSTISAAKQLINAGLMTSREITEHFLEKISLTDDSVKAWVLVDAARARAEADAADGFAKSGLPLRPLHGIPIGIKDVIDVSDWPTAAGSQLWRQSVAREDAACVRLLRNAGAILLGKTVTTAFASFDPSPTKNPRYPGLSPGGSSSGSAAAVAAGHCLAALGTQTGGSILRPATYCGVLGFKPTIGLVPTRGVVPLARSLDHVGVLASCATDLSLVAGCLIQKGAWDLTGDAVVDGSSTSLFVDDELNSMFSNEDSNTAFDEAISKVMGAGISVNKVKIPNGFNDALRHHRTLMACEAHAWHHDRWKRHPADYPSAITSLLEEGATHDSRRLLEAQSHRRAFKKMMKAWWPLGGCLAMPATPTSPPGMESTGDPRCQSPWSYLGFPTVSIPIPRTRSGLPFGIQLAGPAGSDKSLLQFSLRIESALS